MKYQITCAHCDTRFLVEGKGGQTIECTCPGCGGTMRVTLPKSDKGNTDEDSDDDYQTGYAPTDTSVNDNGEGGNDNGEDNGGNKNHRGLALGCLIFVVIAAAAVVAFMALNHTTKKPIEDPYEFVEPDTTSMDSVEEDTVPEVVDTIEVHKEEPKVEAAPVDTLGESEEEATEGQEATEPSSSDATTETSSDKSSSSDHKAKDTSSKDKSSKDKSSSKEKSSSNSQ